MPKATKVPVLRLLQIEIDSFGQKDTKSHRKKGRTPETNQRGSTPLNLKAFDILNVILILQTLIMNSALC
ncbi:hypothetical protein HOLleu_15405 [Holothuria leucospilota]|uniref:Uncharacterized protein n=1 Tax=Holothuria leucospilota TaxID=206669 RepID=A0A9Q1CA72_HOLLE|nr:hypothetical protein HOLleu_15405 [Holothuria leucospilota]